MKTFEDYLRRLAKEGYEDVPFAVNEYGVSVTVQLADKGPKTFFVRGNTVSTTIDPVPESEATK